MNTSTLVALQRKWEPFAQSKSCRYPICFSESEDDIGRSAVSAKVQMIINNLQSDESSLHSGSEYGCIMHKKQKGAKGRGHKLRRSGRVLQEHITYPQHDCPADSDGMEVEESSEFGPLLVHSDSDDSVDRDIEEAIQEYLKNKVQNVQPLPSSARGLHGIDGEKQVHHGCPWSDPAGNVFPANIKGNVVQQHLAPDCLGDDTIQWAASPCSVSSDDSFEQSIKAEIEQFLNEKKQQARNKATAGGNEQLDQKETQEKLALRSQKEDTNKVSPSSQKRGNKAQHLDLQDISTPRCLKSKTDEEPAGFKTKQTQIKRPLAGHTLFLEQSREGEKRQELWKAREEQRYESKDLSDSSSDDGIEEAIQLYQLEKIRKAADSQTGCVAFEKEDLRASKFEDISAHLMIHSVKSALPEIPKKVLSSKRKQVTSKPDKLSRMSSTHYSLDNGKNHVLAESNIATCAVTLQASCRADSAAELMCAEAILDISKTILPLPVGTNSQSFTTDPVFHNTSASQHESDNSTVDSDDSIEQEIRAFLAVKAQTEHLITKSKAALHSVQIPPSSGQPVEQIQSLKHTSPKPLKHSLTRKRKLKGDSKIVRGTKSIQQRLSEMSYCCVGNNHSKISASQEDFTIPQNRVSGRVARCPQNTLATCSSVDFSNPPSQGFLEFGKNATQRPQKCRVDDKSSSLDSDEDLDTAIKELLRSKRKLKKKSKDQRAQCKKKVRFGDSEMHVLEEKERDCKSKKTTLLKSCLMNSQRDIRMENTEPQNIVKGKLKGKTTIQFEFKKECQTKPNSRPDVQEASENNRNLWTATSLTDDSSSVDSDDSIEQEIRRFLAEKSKDSTVSTKIPVSNGIVGNLGVVKPCTSLSKAKCQQFQGRSNAFSKQKGKNKKEGPPVINLQNSLGPEEETAGSASHNGEQTTSYTEHQCCCTVVNSQENQGIVLSERPGLPLKRTPEERKVIFDGKLNQRNLPPGRTKPGTLKCQIASSLCLCSNTKTHMNSKFPAIL
ncbi:hypothetical protein JD844_004719 [Phrynosoma platyrhinos]|uniref:Protein phosphatase 1 regulatory subunit 26 N-terminal domain-containing protein n=1 Tax=Phrynosoma platyrhinos TaxID=52577 RepID=A0ABQ7SDP8_PHRPL|nr:hypothetical protein JD844_004719 [Phrynosoma platyrhinos]